MDEPTVIKTVLIMVGKANKSGRFMGITRIQKLVYLLSISPQFKSIEEKMRYQPLHYGPYSSEVQNALDSLIQFGYITTEKMKIDLSVQEKERGDEESLEEIEENKEYVATVEYKLTPMGQAVADRLFNILSTKEKNEIENIVKEYARLDLKELLRRVYKIAPDNMLARSVIRDQLGY